MDSNTQTIGASVYFSYAENNLTAWRAIIGQRITHRKFGSGTILEITESENPEANSSAWVRFERPVESPVKGLTDTVELSLEAFRDKIVTDLTLPPHLMEEVAAFEQFKTKQDEAEARQNFKRLKEKYQVTSYRDSSPLSRLNAILIDLQDEKRLTVADEKWLKEERLFQVLAIYYEQIGQLASAGSNWRKANNPNRALEITKGEIALDNAAILTMRGGAFRDLGSLDKAENCGRKAIEFSPERYHPYNLLGAVYCQRGLPTQGEKYFEKARESGSSPIEEDNSIRSAVEKAGETEQRSVAEYLLKKAPERYQWAKYYVT